MESLFITRHYLDQMLGGPNCSKAFVKAAASLYPSMGLVYPEHEDHDTALDFLDECPRITMLAVNDGRPKWRKCADMYRGYLHRFAYEIPKLLRGRHFDVVFIDHSVTASSGILESALESGAKVVTFHHNVESQYIRDNQQNLLFRYPYNHYALKAEREAVMKSTLNLVLTEDDRRTFIRMYPERAETFHTIGVFEYDISSEQRLSQAEDHTFVISGSLSAKQTETAMLDFLDGYMDIVNEVCPDAQLVITGRNPSKRIYQSASRYGNVRIVPNPEDLVGEVVKGCYYLCPIFTGGGLKLRCMDALRVGLPVLAHRNAMRGYESIQQDGYMYPYSSKEEFAEGLRRLLQLHHCHAGVAQSFRSHFSFEAGKERLKRILEDAHCYGVAEAPVSTPKGSANGPF